MLHGLVYGALLLLIMGIFMPMAEEKPIPWLQAG